MLGTIFYAVGCFFLAMILSTLLVMTRPIHLRDDMKPWKTFIFVYVFIMALPYIWCETLTRAYGKAMEPAILKAYAASTINGPLRYYKVVTYNSSASKVLVVGTDNQDWGGTDSPVISVNLIKDDSGNWKADSFKVLTSGRLNQDCFVFPPYY